MNAPQHTTLHFKRATAKRALQVCFLGGIASCLFACDLYPSLHPNRVIEAPTSPPSAVSNMSQTEADALWKNAKEQYYARNFAPALADLQKLTSAFPSNAEYLSIKGGSEVSTAKYDDAIRDYTKVIQLAPTAGGYADRAFAYNCKAQYVEGLADCNKAIELDPKYARAYQTRGWCYNGMKNYQLALESINKAIDLKLQTADVYNNRGWAYKDLGKFEQAIADYNLAISKDKNYAIPYYGRALAYEKLGKKDLAAKDRAMMKKLNFIEPTATP